MSAPLERLDLLEEPGEVLLRFQHTGKSRELLDELVFINLRIGRPPFRGGSGGLLALSQWNVRVQTQGAARHNGGSSGTGLTTLVRLFSLQ